MGGILGGRQDKAMQSIAERNYVRTGESLLERGRRLSNPNLLFLKENAPLSENDRANALAASKASTAQAAGAAVPAVLTGLRGGGVGINSGNARLALDDAAFAAGATQGANQIAVDRRLDDQNLGTQGTLAETAVKGTGSALEGLRASLQAQNMSGLLTTMAGNEERKARATEATNLGMAAIKGLGRYASAKGTTMSPGGTLDAGGDGASPFATMLARMGFTDDATLAGKTNRFIATPAGSFADDHRIGFGSFFRKPRDTYAQYSLTNDQADWYRANGVTP